MRTVLKVIIFVLCSSSVYGQQSNTTQSLRVIDSLYSNTLNETREFWVTLPENYNPNSTETYPVVYVLDGFSLENTLKTVYNNYLGHYLPHMILVGISNRKNRTRDLTISQVKNRRGSAVNYDTGGADNFKQFIEKELIPYIDKTLPTTNYRTLIGHSYAGLFTLNMLINDNHLFKNYIAIDPSIEWDNQKLLKQAKEKLKTQNYQGKSLYVSLATEQLQMWDESVTIDNVMEDTSEFTLFPRSIIEFSNLASSQKQNGLNFSWKIYPEDLHGTVPLPSIKDGLIFCFKWFQFKSPQKYNNPETTVQELLALLKTQENIYANELGYSVAPMIEELFVGYGYMNLQMGRPKKALMFFNQAVKYYPNSANGYDALADYYIENNDKVNALKNASKAFKLSGSDFHKEKVETLKAKQ